MIDVHVRGIDPEMWRALRIEAVERGTTVAKVLNELHANNVRMRVALERIATENVDARWVAADALKEESD